MPFAELNVKIDGISELQARLRHLDEGMKEQVRYALAFEGESIKATAQSLCPVRTGYLRSTIYAQIENWTLKIGASAHYAAYVEFGTRFMRARRFLARAVELRLQSLVNAVHRAIDRAIREASH
jgi:HK97 gp10 family phage protein